jgi:hypothetical protein
MLTAAPTHLVRARSRAFAPGGQSAQEIEIENIDR